MLEKIAGFIGCYIIMGLIFGYFHGIRCLRMRHRFDEIKTDDGKPIEDKEIKTAAVQVALFIWPVILITMTLEVLLWIYTKIIWKIRK